MLKHIRENDIFRWRLKYSIAYIKDPGKLQPEHWTPQQVPSVVARQKEP